MIEQKYNELCQKPSDINEHLPVLKKYAAECTHVTEMGVRWVVSTWAFLAAKPEKLVSYDVNYHPNVKEAQDAAGDSFQFIQSNVLETEIEETDLLFIDTWHVYGQLQKELEKHAEKARKYIILHDTSTFGLRGEDGGKGLKTALNEFLEKNVSWVIKEEFTNNNGLTVLERVEGPVQWVQTTIPPEHFEKGWVTTSTQKVKFIIPLPDVKYYLWQALVQINNLQKFGYDVEAHYLVCYFNGKPTEVVQQLAKADEINATFHLYADQREDKSYSASMKPWLMGKYFEEFPNEKKHAYVYLDPDVIFLEPINLSEYLFDDVWYESDTRSYLDSKYIKSKGDQLFSEMCVIADIDRELVEKNDAHAGGAQYITKNNTADFWFEVERLSTKMYKHMKSTASKYHPDGHQYPIQAWTSEMWLTNWVAWKRGIETRISEGLNFHWANHSMSGKTHKIFHNAGVTENDGKHFAKTHYQSSPFRKEIKCGDDSLSSLYAEEVRQTEQAFPSLIWD